MIDVRTECRALGAQIAADRDYLHAHPELSGQEEQTLAWIERRLTALGLPVDRVEHGGLVTVLDGRGPGKRLVEGVSHACGHDAHTAMLLSALQVLSAHREEWSGQIVAVFEQGEETSYGVIPLLEYLEDRFDGMDGCFAIHVYADAPAGTISVQPGYAERWDSTWCSPEREATAPARTCATTR